MSDYEDQLRDARASANDYHGMCRELGAIDRKLGEVRKDIDQELLQRRDGGLLGRLWWREHDLTTDRMMLVERLEPLEEERRQAGLKVRRER